MQLILDTFTGIGLLGIGFKEAGFCVVSAGDTILGEQMGCIIDEDTGKAYLDNIVKMDSFEFEELK